MLIAAISLAEAAAFSAPAGHRRADVTSTEENQLRSLFDQQQQNAQRQREAAIASVRKLEALGRARDLWPLPPRLKAHDIPVITLEGQLTAEALASLLAHECCAVHVRGFLSFEMCTEVAKTLDAGAFSNWNVKVGDDAVASDVDKFGLTSQDALESWESFAEYLHPSTKLPRQIDPFGQLRAALDGAHPEGCRLDSVGGYSLPAGAFRRMRSSRGLIHADTASLLSTGAGEFSANLYIRTPKGCGALSIYPAEQYAPSNGGVANPMLVADLQALALRQAAGFDENAQAYINSALPLKRTVELCDGDLVLINTGRFHRVEPYTEAESADLQRLSGQCWLSHRQGRPLFMWV